MDGRKVRHTCERQGIRNGRNAHCQNRLDACRTRTRFFRLKAHPEGCTCGCADNRQIIRLSTITADDSLEDLYKHYSNGFRKAVDSVFGDEYPEMADQLRANVSRFSAYKANYVRQAFDDNARQFSGKDLDDANRATINQFRRWTDAELTTAGARARTAKQFTEFNEPDRRELFPCLKWLPSRAVNPRQSHMRFYNRVWRKDDTFWDNNAPGTEWNCMCDIEECDDQPTDNSKVKQPDIPKGLEGNPSVTGEIFTDKASYIAKSEDGTEQICRTANLSLTAKQGRLLAKENIITKEIDGDIYEFELKSFRYNHDGKRYKVDICRHYARSMFGNDNYWLKNEILLSPQRYLDNSIVKATANVDHHNTGAATIALKEATDKFFYLETELANGDTIILHVGRYKGSQKLYLYAASERIPEYVENPQ